jgi:truncated hemoglobin YjbI
VTSYDPNLAARLAKELLEYAKQDWSIGSIRTKEAGEQLAAAVREVARLEPMSRDLWALSAFREACDDLERVRAERDALRAEVESLRNRVLVPLTERKTEAT